MSAHHLDRRLDKLEHGRPADRGQRIDPATLTDEQLAVCERVPRTDEGLVDVAAMLAMSDGDLRVIASIVVD